MTPAAPGAGPSRRAPARRARVAIAAAIGLAAGTFCALSLARPGAAPDFLVFWFHARTLVAGGDPYLTPLVVGPHRSAPFMYPLPALFFIAPLAWLPMPVAGGIFLGASSALLAYLMTGDGYYRLPLFLSGPFIVAATFGQWSPLLTTAALAPWLGGLAIIKPNIGLGLFAYRPTRTALVSGVVLLAASVVVVPRWPIEWLHLLRTGHQIYHVPAATAAGVLLPLALLRWRTGPGRLVGVLALVPQLVFFYDQLPLWLTARTLRESTLLTLASLIAWFGWLHSLSGAPTVNEYIPAALHYVVAGIYLPALVLALRPWEWRGSHTAANPGDDAH